VTTMFDFPAVYQAYIACRRGKRSSHNTQRYEVRLLDHLVSTSEALQSRRWAPANSVSFVCTRPKAREIHAADFGDRVVHHLCVPKMEALYEPVFIHDSYSNRKGKGTHAAVNRLQGFMRQVSCNGKRSAYFLQLDIRNFFNRIDRQVLLGLLQHRLEKALTNHALERAECSEIYWLCSVLLKHNAADGAVKRGSPAEFDAVPAYKRLANAPDGCGLAIGNLTSQFFANVYLNELDQYIKHTLKCRHYLRYVDDFVLLHASERQLLQWRDAIQDFLAVQLKLELKEVNAPMPISSGCDFLGYITRSNYRLVRKRVIHHCEEKLRSLERKIVRQDKYGMSILLKQADREQLRASLCSYFGHFQHASSFHLEQSLFVRFVWLKWVFHLDDEKNRKPYLQPLWKPEQFNFFYSQWHWFDLHFKGFVQLIQLGKCFACFGLEHGNLSQGILKIMKDAKPIAGFDAMRIAPLSSLKGVRAWLRCERCAHIFVAEEGYARGGMKQRVLRLLWQPVLN